MIADGDSWVRSGFAPRVPFGNKCFIICILRVGVEAEGGEMPIGVSVWPDGHTCGVGVEEGTAVQL